MKVFGDVEEKEEQQQQEEVKENQSIDSAVINGLFEGILEQSDDRKDHSDGEEEEEEDALNISSMSLLTPLAETVAAVVKSPDRKMMVAINFSFHSVSFSFFGKKICFFVFCF